MAPGVERVLFLVWFVHTSALQVQEQRSGGILTQAADEAPDPSAKEVGDQLIDEIMTSGEDRDAEAAPKPAEKDTMIGDSPKIHEGDKLAERPHADAEAVPREEGEPMMPVEAPAAEKPDADAEKRDADAEAAPKLDDEKVDEKIEPVMPVEAAAAIQPDADVEAAPKPAEQDVDEKQLNETVEPVIFSGGAKDEKPVVDVGVPAAPKLGEKDVDWMFGPVMPAENSSAEKQDLDEKVEPVMPVEVAAAEKPDADVEAAPKLAEQEVDEKIETVMPVEVAEARKPDSDAEAAPKQAEKEVKAKIEPAMPTQLVASKTLDADADAAQTTEAAVAEMPDVDSEAALKAMDEVDDHFEPLSVGIKLAADVNEVQKSAQKIANPLSPAEKELDDQVQKDVVPRMMDIGKSYGDPHMQNIFGQRFDLMQQGEHTLVQIPRGAFDEESLLLVGARVSRVGAGCQDMYIMEVNVTGVWVEESGSGNLHFEAGVDRRRLEGKWLRFGPMDYTVDFKVVQGKTKTKVPYLNFFVRNLAKVGHHIGGLLGEDSHELEAMPSFRCQSSVNLVFSKGAPFAEEMTRSVAEAALK